MRGQPLFAPGGADERGGIRVDDPLSPQEASERPDRGELARSGGARVAAPVQIAEKLTDAGAIHVLRRDLGPLAARRSSEECQELAEIAFIRTDRVVRRVLV